MRKNRVAPCPAVRDIPLKGESFQDMNELFLDIENEPSFRGAGRPTNPSAIIKSNRNFIDEVQFFQLIHYMR